MKKKTIAGLIAIVALVVGVIFAGCIEERSSAPVSTPTPTPTLLPKTTPVPTPTSTLSPLLEIETPNWDLHKTEVGKIATSERWQGEIHIIDRTVHLKPPFYEDSIPFTYKLMKEELTSPPFASYIEIHHDFGNFQNLFIYENQTLKFKGIPNGAITMDKSGNRLAEA